MDYFDRRDDAVTALAGWVESGELRVREDIIDGLEQAPRALVGLLHGDNVGKRMVRVADPQTAPRG
jgi:NADPH-dependent curcumin reductase CurA